MSGLAETTIPTRVRVLAWTLPRSASTVFMKSISANGDVKAYLEPYATAEHFGPEGRLKLREELATEPTYTAEAIKGWLEAEETRERSIFVKELAYAVDDRYHVIPDGYRHSFLIRKPYSVFKSYFRIFNRMEGDAVENVKEWLPATNNIYKSLSDLVEYVEMNLKQEFVIIDSDDIMKSPAEMIQKYCDKVGLIYNEGLLHWEKGIPESWYIAESILKIEKDFQWMGNAINSTGWGVGIKKPPAQEGEFPQDVLDMIEAAAPYTMRGYEIIPDACI